MYYKILKNQNNFPFLVKRKWEANQALKHLQMEAINSQQEDGMITCNL